MLSATSEYALRAAMVLAREYGRRSMRADEIADATGAPRNYMAKTLSALVKSGLATSSRGPQGGFQLASPPASLSVADVIDTFDEPRPHHHCLLGNSACNPAAPCPAHVRWTAIEKARREPLSSTTLADLLGEYAGSSEITSPRSHLHVVQSA